MDDLLDEVLVVRQLERLGQMWLQPVCAPDSLDAAGPEPHHRGHGANAPMRRVRRFGVQRQLNHLGDLRRRQGLAARRTAGILQKPVDPLARKRRRQRRTVSWLLPVATEDVNRSREIVSSTTLR
jgi:hypothetical protein